MAHRRTQEEWLEAITEYKASGLTIRDFCREKRTCPSHFNKRMKEMESASGGAAASAFVRALPAVKKVAPSLPCDSLSLRYKDMTLVFGQLPDPSWLMQLLDRLR